MNTPIKRCSKCGEEFPATTEYFPPQKNGKYGLRGDCRVCNRKAKLDDYYRHHDKYRETQHNYYQEHREELIEYQRQYKAESREAVLERKRRYRQENPDKVREQVRHAKAKRPEHYRKMKLENKHRRQAENPEKYRVKATEQSRKWREKHPGYKPPSKGKFSAEHPEEMKEYRRQWKRRNPEKIRASSQARRAAKLKINGSHTAEDIKLQYKSQRGKCWHCGADLEGKYHVDHLIPLSRGGSNDARNIVLACAKCNISKKDKLPHEWNGKLF